VRFANGKSFHLLVLHREVALKLETKDLVVSGFLVCGIPHRNANTIGEPLALHRIRITVIYSLNVVQSSGSVRTVRMVAYLIRVAKHVRFDKADRKASVSPSQSAAVQFKESIVHIASALAINSLSRHDVSAVVR
jgi:hypothetical protein